MVSSFRPSGFAANRRTKGGPADHDLPALVVSDPDGKLRGIFISYACHCTTVTGEFNQICGDWAGYGAEALHISGSDFFDGLQKRGAVFRERLENVHADARSINSDKGFIFHLIPDVLLRCTTSHGPPKRR